MAYTARASEPILSRDTNIRTDNGTDIVKHNLLQNRTVKEFLKSVNICQSYAYRLAWHSKYMGGARSFDEGPGGGQNRGIGGKRKSMLLNVHKQGN